MSQKKWCALSEIASVGLGFKSLQNDFFYLDEGEASRFAIEKEYLVPIYRLRDLDPKHFRQTQPARLWLFNCRVPERDLRGTKALAYIRAMASRPATVRKQSRTESTETIKQVLQKQGGEVWYYPKASAHREQLWVRKAFNSVYAPFLFRSGAVVDQRCNFIRAHKNVSAIVLEAIASSTIFAFALEVEGAAALGQGALEVPTNGLGEVSVPDIRLLEKTKLDRLAKLAGDCWDKEAPLNWGEDKAPGPKQRALDEFVLKCLTPSLPIETVYRDLAELCRDRVSVGSQKGEMKRGVLSADVDRVVARIAEDLEPIRDRRRFPEDYVEEKCPVARIELPKSGALRVSAHPLLTEAEILIEDSEGHPLVSATIPAAVAEVISAAVLSGRRSFSYPTAERDAAACYSAFRKDLGSLITKIDDSVRSSALGTKYESEVKKRVFSKLGLDTALELSAFGTFLLGFDAQGELGRGD